MKFKRNFLWALILMPLITFAQEDKTTWFPSESVFPILQADLLAPQVYSGIFYFKTDADSPDGAYIPANLGVRKSILAFSLAGFKIDLAVAAAVYTQFSMERYDANTLRGGLLNIDYKASGLIHASRGKHKFRLQLFHVSSHLGDDYILRNEDYSGNDKSVNYEQLDLSYMYALSHTSFYVTLGEIVTPHAYRKRFMGQIGAQGSLILKNNWKYFWAVDSKIYAENNYDPDIHLLLGIGFEKNNNREIQINFDAYSGKMPYSTLDYGSVFWFGVSTIISI